MAGHPNAVVAFRLSFVAPGSVEPVRVRLHAPHLRPCTSRGTAAPHLGGGGERERGGRGGYFINGRWGLIIIKLPLRYSTDINTLESSLFIVL